MGLQVGVAHRSGMGLVRDTRRFTHITPYVWQYINADIRKK
jgi:hypothetical protein